MAWFSPPSRWWTSWEFPWWGEHSSLEGGREDMGLPSGVPPAVSNCFLLLEYVIIMNPLFLNVLTLSTINFEPWTIELLSHFSKLQILSSLPGLNQTSFNPITVSYGFWQPNSLDGHKFVKGAKRHKFYQNENHYHVYHYQRMCFSISRCWWLKFFLSLFFYHHYHDYPHYHHQRKSLLISRCWGVKLRRCLHFFVGLVRGSGAGKSAFGFVSVFSVYLYFSLCLFCRKIYMCLLLSLKCTD